MCGGGVKQRGAGVVFALVREPDFGGGPMFTYPI